MFRNKVLIADADSAIRRFVKANLEARGFFTCYARNGRDALVAIEEQSPNVVIVDSALPGIDGLSICRTLRARSPVPIIMLSAEGTEQARIDCFDAGADDCLLKPFNIDELIARVRAVVRRIQPSTSFPTASSFRAGKLEISFDERRVRVADREVRLTPTEFSLLQELALNCNRVLTHGLLLQKVWGPEYGGEKEYLRVFIGRLRKKLGMPSEAEGAIETVPWIGYRLTTSRAGVGTA